MKERISQQECIRLYKVDISFLNALEDADLLHPETEDETKYIIFEELTLLEKFMSWHYDLDVNLPGIEVMHHLLQKMEILQQENQKLMQRLFFETDNL